MHILLVRDLDNGVCSLGVLSVAGITVQTLERPWKPGPPGGTKGVSCVPSGMYRLVQHDSEQHPRSFALVNEALSVYHMEVPAGHQGRTAVLIHPANFVQELRGCIAPGMQRALNGTVWSVQSSRIAMGRFNELVSWQPGHTLEIRGLD